MTRPRLATLALVFAATLSCERSADTGLVRWARELIPEPPAARAGAALFAAHCADCHGTDGDGRGPGAASLVPKPRDFRAAVFKFRTTRGQPTREDLVAVITDGVPGTGMPGFPTLSAADRLALAEHVRLVAMRGRFLALCRIRASSGEELTLAGAAREAEQVRAEFAATSLPCPPPPEDAAASARRGAVLFASEVARCVFCHGPAGRGDGPQAPFLEDRWGNRTPPRDLRLGTRVPVTVFQRIQSGVGGTAMPAFAGTLSEEQIWDLAHFVLSLAPAGPATPASGPAHR